MLARSLDVVDHVQHQPLVDQQGGMAEAELVAGEGAELHRILDQARAGGETRPRHPLQARIIVRHRLEHALVIDAGRLGDQIELVGGGEFDVAVGVAEQLGEFRLYRRNHHHFRRDALEQRRRFALGVRRGAADDLRHVGAVL